MNINMKSYAEKKVVEHIDTCLNTTRTIWEIMTIRVLHEEFGFGEKRLMQFAKALEESYDHISREMSITDSYKKSSVATNLDTAVIRAVMALRRDGIDYRRVLSCEDTLVIIEKDGKRFSIDEYVDREIERENERRQKT